MVHLRQMTSANSRRSFYEFGSPAGGEDSTAFQSILTYLPAKQACKRLVPHVKNLIDPTFRNCTCGGTETQAIWRMKPLTKVARLFFCFRNIVLRCVPNALSGRLSPHAACKWQVVRCRHEGTQKIREFIQQKVGVSLCSMF